MILLKKRILIPALLILLIGIFLFQLSTLTKNYLEKNSEKLTGRKITIGEMHFNYAKVSVQVKNFVMFETNKTDQFVSFDEFYIRLNPWTLLRKEYSVSEIRLVNPQVQVIQDGSSFNFDSLIKKDSSDVKKKPEKKEPVKFTIRNIQLTNGKIKYSDIQKKSEFIFKDISLHLPLIAWNNKQSNMGIDFTLGEKGRINVQALVDNQKQNYQIDLSTENVDIQPIKTYLTDYFDVQSLTGLLSAKIKIAGDMNEVINLNISGNGKVDDFSVTDGRSEKLLTAPQVNVTITDINLKSYRFNFGKIELQQPELIVERGKKDLNIMQFFSPYFKNASGATATKTTDAQEPSVTYHIDTIKVDNGLLTFADNTLNRPFKYELNDLNATMTGLSESSDEIPVTFSTKLNNRGQLEGKTVWSMQNLMKLQLEARLKRMDLVSLSPYTEYYIASPITQGWFNYDLGLKMTTTSLVNTNKIKIDELEFGKRTKDTTATRVPVRLGLYLMKDSKGIIAFDLPVSGNPSEPKFKLGKIIWHAFLNMIVKAAASPFKALAGLVGSNPESMEKLPFEFAQDSLTRAQRDNLANLATVLKKKPELIVNFTQTTDPEKEKARIAVELTKADFVASQNANPAGEKVNVSLLKNDNPDLLAFIRKSVPAADSTGIEAACLKRTDAGRVENRFLEILNQRNKLITGFLVQNQGIPAEAVLVSTADFKNLPQELKIPQFKVEVSVK